MEDKGVSSWQVVFNVLHRMAQFAQHGRQVSKGHGDGSIIATVPTFHQSAPPTAAAGKHTDTHAAGEVFLRIIAARIPQYDLQDLPSVAIDSFDLTLCGAAVADDLRPAMVRPLRT